MEPIYYLITFIVIFIIAPAIIIPLCFILTKRRNLKNKKIDEDLIQNNPDIKRIQEINSRYLFYPYNNQTITNTYDNQAYYNTISCEDYLIYQLQFIQKDLSYTCKKIQENRELFKTYSNEIKDLKNSVELKNKDIKGFNNKKILSRERALLEKFTQSPTIYFTIKVILYHTNMYGRITQIKRQIFDAQNINLLIKRINNRSGFFFNDRDIWDAITRVERGKVSNKVRFSIYERDGYRCQICKKRFPINQLEIDHIKPIAKGGKTTYGNLQTLCWRCNKEKGDKY